MSLAIIIPAYKDLYLRASLNSLAAQSNRDFSVYVGDDNSPGNIRDICDEYRDELNLTYHRFAVNLGKKDLVAHWERCLQLAGTERWIWLFSDDDVMERDCVATFYHSLGITNESYDVYRFNTAVIDNAGQVIYAAEPSPTVENAARLLYHILLMKRGNSMPDHIFKKEVLREKGGIQNFIQAQASDWATSVKMAFPKGLYTMPGARVFWRMSGQNISALAHTEKARLIFGHLQFIEWAITEFEKRYISADTITLPEIVTASKINLRHVIVIHYKGFPASQFLAIAKTIRTIYHETLFQSLWFCLKCCYSLAIRKAASHQ